MREDEAVAVSEVRARRPFAFSSGFSQARVVRALAGLALCAGLAACQTDGSGMASSGSRALAFDTIDGPPQATFEKLVGDLSSEAQTRRVAVVSRSTAAAYRVKGYLAMHVDRGNATVAYAWDVYDQSQTRVARVTGEEPAGRVKGARDGWAACDDAVVARIADRSMASLADALGAPATTAMASASAPETAPAAEPARPDSSAGTPVAALSAGSGASAPAAALAYAAN